MRRDRAEALQLAHRLKLMVLYATRAEQGCSCFQLMCQSRLRMKPSPLFRRSTFLHFFLCLLFSYFVSMGDFQSAQSSFASAAGAVGADTPDFSAGGEIDPDFADELDPGGISSYLNMLPAEAGRDSSAMRLAKPRRVPVRPQGRMEWVKLRAIAREYVKETNLELAKAQYETILQTKVNGLPARTIASLHIELGTVLIKLGNEEGARYHYQEARSFVPQHAQPHVRLAQLATQLGHFDDAVDHYKHALFYNNSHSLALHNLGSLLFAQCKIEEASYYFAAAVHRRSDHNTILLRTVDARFGGVANAEDAEHSLDVESGRDVGRTDSIVATSSNIQLSKWLTDHICGIFSVKQDSILDENTMKMFSDIYALTGPERRWVVGHVLNNLAGIMLDMGLFDEAMQAWHLMHSERLMGSASVFLPRYATALPKILEHPSVRGSRWTETEAMQALRSRMSWAWREIRTTNTQGNSRFAILESMKHDPALEQWPISHINPIGVSLLALRHHITSNSLIEHRNIEKQDRFSGLSGHDQNRDIGSTHEPRPKASSQRSFSTSISLMDFHRVSAEAMALWSRDAIEGLHASSSVMLSLRPSFQRYEQGGMPSDPSTQQMVASEDLARTHKSLRRLEAKNRAKRKRKRVHHSSRNSRSSVVKASGKGHHSTVRDHRAANFERMAKLKRNRRRRKRKEIAGVNSWQDNFPDADLPFYTKSLSHRLPPIRIGFFCEALKPEKYASDPGVQLVKKLIQRTVMDFHVTLFIPPWTNQQISNPQGQAFRDTMTSMADDFVSVNPLESVTVHSLSNFHASLSSAFSTLAIEGDISSKSLPRVDVLILIGATTGRAANFLAHSRLAPVQVAYWSGAGTTGLAGGAGGGDERSSDIFSKEYEKKASLHKRVHGSRKTDYRPRNSAGAVDYFVAPEIILEDEAQRAYSEQLVRLPGTGAILPPTIEDLPDSAKPGSSPQYKFKNGALYLYAKYTYAVVLHESLSEIHPEFDSVLADLLARVPNVQILLVSRRDRGWENTMGYGRLVRRIRDHVQQRHEEAVLLKKHAQHQRSRHEKFEEAKEGDSLVDQDADDRGHVGDSSTAKLERGEAGVHVETQKKDNLNQQGKYDYRRVRQVTGLSRSEYLSLIAAVDLVLDPATADGGGLETALVPTLEALMIGTPVVSLRANEEKRGWDRMQPTSSAAGIIQSVGGDAMVSLCVAENPQEYAKFAAALLAPKNRTAQLDLFINGRNSAKAWVEKQNVAVGDAWIDFLERIGRPYADWRGESMLKASSQKKGRKE